MAKILEGDAIDVSLWHAKDAGQAFLRSHQIIPSYFFPDWTTFMIEIIGLMFNLFKPNHGNTLMIHSFKKEKT